MTYQKQRKSLAISRLKWTQYNNFSFQFKKDEAFDFQLQIRNSDIFANLLPEISYIQARY